MGQIADDMIDGTCCEICGCYFEKDGELYTHGYPVTCSECWDDMTREGKKHHTKTDCETL